MRLILRAPIAALVLILIAGAMPALAWDSLKFDLPSGGKEDLWRERLARCLGKGRDAEWERIGSWTD